MANDEIGNRLSSMRFPSLRRKEFVCFGGDRYEHCWRERNKGVGNLFLVRGGSKSSSGKAAGESKLGAYSLGSTVRLIRTTKSVLAPEW